MERNRLDPEETFYVIDGHSQIHRAFHSPLQLDLSSPDGIPTKAIYVFFNCLMKIIREHKPRFLAIAFDDNRESTFRRRLSPKYKAHRSTNEELKVQIKWIRKIVDEMGIATFGDPEYEADDLIASLVCHDETRFFRKVIVSRDKDLHQLVTPDVRMYDAILDEWFGVAEVEKKWKVTVHQIPLMKAIIGDSGDGVDGIVGIGEVGALELVKRFGTVDGILNGIPLLKRKHREALQEQDLRLQMRLVSVVRTVPLNLDWYKLEAKNVALANAAVSFRHLGFKRWADGDRWVKAE